MSDQNATNPFNHPGAMASSPTRVRRAKVIGLIAISVSVWIVLALLFMLDAWVWPRTWIGWLLVFGAGPMAWVLMQVVGEAGVEAIRGLPVVRSIRFEVEKATAGDSFSASRIVYLLFETLLILVVLLVAVAIIAWMRGTI